MALVFNFILFFQNEKVNSSNSPAEKPRKQVSCVRCKTSLPSKEDLRKHLETCNWKCGSCGIQLRDPKTIKFHRNKCGGNCAKKSNNESSKTNGEETTTGLVCKICQRECKHFHYLKGHMSMHYRYSFLTFSMVKISFSPNTQEILLTIFFSISEKNSEKKSMVGVEV